MTDLSSITLSSDVTVWHDIIVTLDRKVGHFEEKLARLQVANAELRAENVRLKARIIELEHPLGKSGRSSSKPPSSDGLAMAKSKAKPGQRKRSSGGQPGHKGHTFYAGKRLWKYSNEFFKRSFPHQKNAPLGCFLQTKVPKTTNTCLGRTP